MADVAIDYETILGIWKDIMELNAKPDCYVTTERGARMIMGDAEYDKAVAEGRITRWIDEEDEDAAL